MNSNSKNYYKDDCDCVKKEKKPCKTIVKCGCPSSTALPLILVDTTTNVGSTFTVSSLTLDTSCLCNPCTKLEFASNIVADVAALGSLTFQVFKLCGNQITPIPVGPSWTFSLVVAAGASTFSFFVYDYDSCYNDCCTYTVVASVTSVVAAGTLSINNATLGAIASDCKYNCC